MHWELREKKSGEGSLRREYGGFWSKISRSLMVFQLCCADVDFLFPVAVNFSLGGLKKPTLNGPRRMFDTASLFWSPFAECLGFEIKLRC